MATLRRNRCAILVCGVLTMLMFGTIYAWSIFIPPLEQEFGWTRSQTALTFSVAMIGLSLGMLSIGQLSKKFSLKACFIAATSLIVLGLFLCQFITQLWQLYVFYGVLCGFGSGMSYTVWTTNALAWFGDKIGFASGVLVMGFGMGALVLGVFASALIYSPAGWRLGFVIIGAIVGIEGCFALGFIQQPDAATAALKPRKDVIDVSLSGSKTVREPSFWLFCLWRSFVMGMGGAVIAQASVMMTGIGSSLAMATFAAGCLGAGNGVGRPIGGIIYDKIGQNKTLVLFPSCALVLSIGMIIAYHFEMPWLFLPFLLLEGVIYGMYAAINTSYMRTTFGQEYLPMNTGISAVILAPFNLVFPLVAALIFEVSGSYFGFFCLMPLFALFSLVAGVLCKPATAKLKKEYGRGVASNVAQ